MTTPDAALTPADVQRALDDQGINAVIRFFDASTAISQQAAAQIGCAVGQIVKSLCFMVDDAPVLVLASGDVQIDDRKLAALYNVSRKKVRAATAEQCVLDFGYPPGSVPPLGHRRRALPKHADRSLLRYPTVYAAAGAPNAIFEVALDALLSATEASVSDLRRDATAGPAAPNEDAQPG